MKNKADTLLSRNDCILLIVDMQEKLIPVIADHDRITGNVVTLTKFARIIGLPILFTEQEKLGSTLPVIKEEIKDFHPIVKIDFNAAKCPFFVTALKNTGRKQMIVAGIESHICIMQTVLHLIPEFTIHIISDAVSSRSPANVAVAIERMKMSGAIISSTETVIYELLGRAGTDEFKSVLPLVK